jgi:glycine/D-amino acid oxidase-like deaminating enzyme
LQKSDVVIAGAGVIGLSIAWQLARRGGVSVLVVEKGASLGEGSTGASSAVCRHRYSRDEMLRLARDGILAYRRWPAFTGLRAPRAEFHKHGVLWMPGEDRDWSDREQARLSARGIASAVLDDEALSERFPSISRCVLAPDTDTGEEHVCRGGGRHLLELDGGYMEPVDVLEDLREACTGAGVTVRMRSPVAGITTAGGRLAGITLGNGERVATPLLINATGPWCDELYAMAGLTPGWDLVPTRIQVLHLPRPVELKGEIPVSVDLPGGVYFRTQNRGQQLVVGSVLEEDEREAVSNPDDFERDPDESFRRKVLHVLHHRLPALPYRGRVQGYCGLYTVNLNDVHPIVGPTELGGFWAANGFSGHGFKLGPAIGAMVARAVTGREDEFDTEVPASFFSLEREPMDLDSHSVLA